MNQTEPVLKWTLTIYTSVLTSSAILNLVFALAIIRCRKNGCLSLVLQLCLVDAASLCVALTEVWALTQQSWQWSSHFCQFFNGTEILCNSLTIYLVVCFNFHVVSLWNLHEWNCKESTKNPLTSRLTDGSNECLVTKQENNRIVNIDYSKKRRVDISVIFPIILVWFVCLSLSIPNYTLSSTLKISQNYTVCAIIAVYYGKVIHYLLILFKIIIPLFLLVISFLILICKLIRTCRKKDIDQILTKKYHEIRTLLIFCLLLTIFYTFTSFQRQFFSFIYVFSHVPTENNAKNFKMPPLYNIYLGNNCMIYLAMLHYSGNIFRAILYLTVLPKFKYLLRSKIFVCCKINK